MISHLLFFYKHLEILDAKLFLKGDFPNNLLRGALSHLSRRAAATRGPRGWGGRGGPGQGLSREGAAGPLAQAAVLAGKEQRAVLSDPHHSSPSQALGQIHFTPSIQIRGLWERGGLASGFPRAAPCCAPQLKKHRKEQEGTFSRLRLPTPPQSPSEALVPKIGPSGRTQQALEPGRGMWARIPAGLPRFLPLRDCARPCSGSLIGSTSLHPDHSPARGVLFFSSFH